MAGRKRKVSIENALQKLSERKDEIIVNNKVVGPNNEIWLAIHESLELKSNKIMQRQ